MKPFLLFLLLNVPPDSGYSVTGYHYENEVTFCKVEFSFGWAVFQLAGNHIGDVNKMVSEGCLLTKRWGLFFFSEVPGIHYVKKSDSEKIKSALQAQSICER